MSGRATVLEYGPLEAEITLAPALPFPEMYMPSERAHAFYRSFLELERDITEQMLYAPGSRGPGPGVLEWAGTEAGR